MVAIAAGAATGFALAARQRSEAAARAEIARRAVSEERLAMAQDVHDGVGHSLAVIAMQAGVAAHVLDRDPARARELLATVVATSREALDGLRADLDRLRTPADGAGPPARRPGWRTCRCCWTGCATAACGCRCRCPAPRRCRRTWARPRTGSCRSR